MTFAFGLLHGFGFASALAELHADAKLLGNYAMPRFFSCCLTLNRSLIIVSDSARAEPVSNSMLT